MSESNALSQAQAIAEGIVAEWRNAPSLSVTAKVEAIGGGAKGVTVRLDAARPSLFGECTKPLPR
jgi:hypothetical protein